MASFAERKAVLQDVLAAEAGLNPLSDRYTVGYLAAINDIENIEIEEVDLGD